MCGTVYSGMHLKYEDNGENILDIAITSVQFSLLPPRLISQEPCDIGSHHLMSLRRPKTVDSQ